MYIWWDKIGRWRVCYKHLKLGETVTGECYDVQLNCLTEKINKRDLILDMDNDIITNDSNITL